MIQRAVALMAAVAVVLALGAAPASAQGSRCPDGWTYSILSGAEKCYRYYAVSRSWLEAEADCNALGSGYNLVSLLNSPENDLVYGLCQSRRCHIGINDIAREGTYVWSDGHSVSYTAWNNGEPNNCCGSEDCGEVWHVGGSQARWNDMPCNGRFGRYHYVCKTTANCNVGTYGTFAGSCTNCPSGRYSASAGAVTVNDCPLCPSGRYGSDPALSSETCSGACAVGHYCPDGSTSSTQHACPPGTYGSSTGLTSSACNGVCGAGYYCESGETSSEPSGKLCAAGRYGSFGQQNSQCTGPCSAGYYCPAGSGSSTQNECGGSNKFCPEGASGATTVTAGYYTLGGASATTRTSQAICEEGYYCVNGVRHLCPAGKYADTKGNTECALNCEAGYFCPTGSRTSTQDVCGQGTHPANSYCPAGTTSRVTVTAGYYSTPENLPANQRTNQAECTADYICANGVRTPKLEWNTKCKEGGTASLTADENKASVTVATIAATSNEGLGVSYSIESSTPSGGCSLTNPFLYSATGVLSVGTTPIDLESCASYELVIKATAAGSVSLTCTVTVAVQDANDPPVIEKNAGRSIEEKSKKNTAVGAPIFASDPDAGQELTFVMSGPDSEKFRIGACSGQIFVKSGDITYQAGGNNVRILTITVTDDGDPQLSDVANVTVQILNINDPPVFSSAPLEFKVKENAVAGQGLIGPDFGPIATDADGDALTWNVSRNDADAFTVNATTGHILVKHSNLLDFEGRSTYNIEITVKDQALTASKAFNIEVVDVNDAPTLEAATFSVREDAVGGTIVGSLTATDQDAGSTVSFQVEPSDVFRIVDVPPMSARIELIASNLNFEDKTQYKLNVTATDDGVAAAGQGLSTSVWVTVDVTNINEPPAIAAQTVSVNEHTPIGTAISPAINATDPDNAKTLTQLLFFSLSDTSKVTIGSLDGVLYVASDLDYEAPLTSFTVNVTVTDNGQPSLSATNTITVNVNNVNEPPVMAATTRSVNELVPIGTDVTPVLTATDPDAGTTLTFTLAADLSNTFTVSSAGMIKTAKEIDYEMISVYSISVTVSDGALQTTAAVTINVNDVNENPWLPATVFSLSEAAKKDDTVGQLQGRDIDAGQENSLTYTLLTDDSPGGLFAVNSTTGLITTTAAAPSYTPDTKYNITVRVTDVGGLSGVGWSSIELVDVNFQPTVPDHHISIPEGMDPYGIILYNMSAADPDLEQTLSYSIIGGRPEQDVGAFFIYRNNGSLRLNGLRLDHEGVNHFELDIQVEDDGPGQLKAYSTVYIDVADIAEGPYVAEETFGISEKAAVGTVVGTVLGTDEDAGDTLTFTMGAWDGTALASLPFEMVSGTGEVKVKGALDFETQEVYLLFTTVSDQTGLSATSNLTINVLNVNEAPSITAADYSISESQPAGALVGKVVASDTDSSTVLTYSIIGGNTGMAFTINAQGDLSLARKLDFENITSYSLTIQVADNGEGTLKASAAFGVTVLDANDMTFEQFSGATTQVSGGGEKVYIHGTNMGPTAYALGNGAAAATVTATYYSSYNTSRIYSPTCSVSTANSVIECTTVPGVGPNLRWSISVDYAGNVQTLGIDSAYTTYRPPDITGVAGAGALATAGNEDVVLTGTDFGPSGTTIAVSYYFAESAGSDVEYAATACSVTTANTQVTCKSAAGVGSNLAFAIRVGSQTSARYAGPTLRDYSYAPPAITGLFAGLLDTSGGGPVTIVGSNFGTGVPVSATYGTSGTEYGGVNCIISVPHSVIVCEAATGVGAGHRWAVAVGGQVSPLSTGTTSYRLPVITDVSGQGASGARTSGGQLVTLSGTDFGPAGGLAKLGAVPVVKYGGPLATRYTASKCNVSTEFPNTVISCFTAEGTGKDHAWKVEIKGQWSAVYAANTSYHAPIVAAFPDEFAGAVDAVTQGGEAVVVEGDYFGSTSLGTNPTVTYGPEGTEFAARDCYILENHKKIRCNTTQGAGADLKWVVTVDGQESRAPTTNYGRPEVTSVSGAGATKASTDGGQTLNVHGLNFGPPDGGADAVKYLEYVKYGPSGTEYTAVGCEVVSHFLVECQTVPGVGGANVVTVRVAGQVSDASTAVQSYAPPIISAVTPDNSPTVGGALITVSGTDFGLNDIFSIVRVSFQGKELNITEPDTAAPSAHSFKFYLPEGYGVDKQVRVVVHGPNVELQSDYALFNYSVPAITGFSPEPTNRAGVYPPEFEVTVFGSSFCASEACGDLYLGPAVMQTLNWTHDKIVLRTNEAQADFLVRVGSAPTRDSNRVYYENVIPVVSGQSGERINSQKYHTSGGDILLFSGTQFSLIGMNVTVGGKPCTFLDGYPRQVGTNGQGEPEYELQCYNPSGQGTINPVIMHLGLQETFDYQGGTSMNVEYYPPEVYDAVLEATGAVVSTSPADSPTVTLHMPTQGGKVLLRGVEFGKLRSETVTLFYRDSVPPVSAPRNHTAMTITLPEGDGTGYDLKLRVGNQDANRMVVSYNAPVITDVQPLNGPTFGSTNITITGYNFGITTPTVLVGTQPCVATNTSHFRIVCTLPANQGVGHKVSVTVNGQTSAQTGFVFNYDKPVVYAVTPLSGNTAGGDIVTLYGTNLGQRDAIVHFTKGTSDIATQTAGANITFQNDTMISFRLMEGQGQDHQVYVDISGQLSATSTALQFSYDPPVIDSIAPLQAPTKGGDLLTLTGSNFGVRGIQVRVNGRLCTQPTQAHAKVTCRIPQGLGQDLPVQMTLINRVSNVVNFTYSPPLVYTVVPNVPDANGAALEVVGVNFGWEKTDAAVTIGGKECLDALWRNDGSLTCTMQRDVAGAKNVSISVAGQTVGLLGPFTPQCVIGYYGQVGELCLPCPMGGVCAGGYAEPLAEAGWWLIQVDTTTAESRRLVASGDSDTARQLQELSTTCPPERANRPTCPVLIPCEPAEACTGDNGCGVGYTGERCSECTIGTHYRLAGECQECPDNPEMVIIFFLIGALGLCIAGYVLNRKRVNLAFLSIGVDYFQVLALFANAKISWPPALYDLFQALSVFNLNVEIAAPECAIPNVEYVTKWYCIMILPLAASGLFFILHSVKYIQKRWIKRVKKDQRNSHLSTMIGSLLVMYYYLYLYLARTTLEVFNCGPTDPPDGKVYMEAVFEECYVPGLTQMTLLPYGVVTLIVYVLLFPMWLWWQLRRNKHKIKMDQILRVMGLGKTKFNNREVYQFRKRYHKMYYHFRPGKWYWIIIIILRKALLAFTALMFRSTTAFQLAMSLLVMFVAYALQVRHRPYMNLHDKTKILAKFQAKVETNSMLYQKISADIRRIVDDARRKTRKARGWEQKRPAREVAQQFFWDYNTVEAVLLFCAVLINLSGIMFESGRFESAYYEGQRDLISYIVIVIVIASFAYFGLVFVAEVFGVCSPKWLISNKKRQLKKAQTRREKKGRGVELADIEGGGRASATFQNNPMLTGAKVAHDEDALREFLGSDVLPPPAVWTVVRQRYAELGNDVQELNDQLRRLKRAASSGGAAGGGAAAAPRRAPRAKPGGGASSRRRREFKAQPSMRRVRKPKAGAKRGGAVIASPSSATDAHGEL